MNKILDILFAVLICTVMIVVPAIAQPTPFVVSGNVYDSNGDPCDGQSVQITNLNTLESWSAMTSTTSNYYQLVLDSSDVNAGEVLKIEASGCSQSKTVEHTVTWSEINSGGFTKDITLEVAAEVDNTTTEDVPVSGTVSGSYVDTQVSDDVYESITEVESKGKPTNRYSYLEHKWTVDVTGGSDVTFYLEAYHSSSSDGDDFVFAYSTDDSTYTDMATVTKIADDDTYQTFDLPGDLSGTVYIRVMDTDQTVGNKALDTIYIDHLFIRSVSGAPDTTALAAVTDLAASDPTSSSIKPAPQPAGSGDTFTVTGLDTSTTYDSTQTKPKRLLI